MANQSKAHLAQQLLWLTEDMRKLAKEGEWALLAQRELERQSIARDLFASPVPAEDARVVAECVRQVLDVDQDLLTLVEQGKDEAAKAMQEVQTAKKATDAYKRFSR